MDITAWEQAKLNLMEANIKCDFESATTRFQYPIIRDLSKLSDNCTQAIAIENKVEASLMKKGIF